MMDQAEVNVQEIYCDGTSHQMPDKPFFSYKSTFHNDSARRRVHIDLSLHVVNKPSQHLGTWRCRVNLWLPANGNEADSDRWFEHYKTGFRLALAGAAKFVDEKYGIKDILAPQSNEELLARYHALITAKQL